MKGSQFIQAKSALIFWDDSKYFEMSLQYFEEKNIFLSKCLFIAIFFYINIVSENV